MLISITKKFKDPVSRLDYVISDKLEYPYKENIIKCK